ncbi:MAG: DNA polymerase III subunit delta [Alphaproteobacteria bacterium]
MIYKQPQIDQYIKKPLSNIKGFLLYGENVGLIESTIKKLIKTISEDEQDPFNVAQIDFENIKKDFGLLSSEYNAVSMMGDRRVVVVKDVSDELTKNIEALFASNSNTLLILSSTSFNKGSSLVKFFEKEDSLSTFACYDDRAEDISKAVKDKLVSNGFTIDYDALTLLISRLSADRLSSMSEIDKLMMYMGNKKNISTENILICVSDVSGSSFDDIIYAACTGNLEKAQKHYETLIKEGEDPSTIVTMLSYHFFKLLQVASFIEDGFTTEEAINKVVPRLIFLRKDSFKSQAKSWNKSKLLMINNLLYDAQKDLRTNNMPKEEIVSYLLMQISSGYKR